MVCEGSPTSPRLFGFPSIPAGSHHMVCVQQGFKPSSNFFHIFLSQWRGGRGHKVGLVGVKKTRFSVSKTSHFSHDFLTKNWCRWVASCHSQKFWCTFLISDVPNNCSKGECLKFISWPRRAFRPWRIANSRPFLEGFEKCPKKWENMIQKIPKNLGLSFIHWGRHIVGLEPA